MFVVNGATYNSLVPRFPALRDALGLSNTALGTAIAAFPAAALILGVLAGPLIARFGSGRVAVVIGLVGAVVLPAVALAPSWAALAAVLFVLGTTDAWADAAMNAHGLRVQERYGRSIINGLHATWSVAAVGAGFLGAAAAGLGVPLTVHLGVVGAVLAVVSLAAGRFLLPGPDPGAVDVPGSRAGGPLRSVLVAAGPLLALAALLVCSGGIEDSAASWGALYVRDDLGGSPFAAGLPFVAFQTAMTLGRLGGDRLVDRWGPVRVARGGALLAAAGMGAGLVVGATVGHPATAVAGFAVTGLGVSTLFPLAFAAAGSVPGVRAGDGVTVVGWLARIGFLIFPPTIGVIADAASVGWGLVMVPASALVAAVLARSLRPRGAVGPDTDGPDTGDGSRA
jgi:fucose permease